MIIVTEGVDKSGKSTLVDKIIKEFPGILVKITDRPVDHSLEEQKKIKEHYQRVMNFSEKNPDTTIVLDRFFPSEICYSFIRGYEAKDSFFFLRAEEWFLEREHLFVFCDPGEDIIDERMEKDPDDYVSLKQNQKVLKRYREFFDNTKLNWIKVDTNQKPEEIIKILKKEINEHKRHIPKGTQLKLF